MEILFEILFQIFGEILLQGIFEALGELGVRGARKLREEPINPWLAGVGYALLGAGAGGLSLLIVPSLLIDSKAAQVMNLVATPVAVGLLMSALGSWRMRHGQELVRLDRFGYGFLFALSMALVRFLGATNG
jgi:hypothetical protein